MSGLKTSALAFLAWMTMATLAHANPTSFLWDWTAWVAATGIKESNSSAGGARIASAKSASLSPNTVPAPAASAATSPPDAYLNFGTSPYLEQSNLTVGTAQPWYNS